MRTVAVFAAVLLGFAAAPAFAAPVDFNGNHYDMGTVAVGQSGTIDTNSITLNSLANGTGYGLGFGFLPPDSEITFTYTIVAPHEHFGSNAQLETFASYNYRDHGTHFYGASYDQSSHPYTGYGWSRGYVHARGGPVDPAKSLVLATADITGPTSGTNTIINNSSSDAFFLSVLDAGRRFGKVVVTYAVTALGVSAVPLPASLPLFLSGLAALAALAYRRRKQAV